MLTTSASTLRGIITNYKEETNKSHPVVTSYSSKNIIGNVNDTEVHMENGPTKRKGRERNVPKGAKPREKPDVDLSTESVRNFHSEDKDLRLILQLRAENAQKPHIREVSDTTVATKQWCN